MPMSKWINAGLRLIQQQLPCLLCGLDVVYKHRLCQHCWRQLPIQPQVVIRQQQNIQVACQYHYPLDRLIQQFKYEQQLQYQQLLAGLLLELKLPKVQALVPMPISTQRLTERGYNQSVLIAQTLSQQLNIPIWQPIERLAQHSQKGLSRLERMQGITQQFKAKTTLQKRYKKVLIIDDVVTTGSSILALSDALSTLGCTHIHAACITAAD